MNSSTAQKMQDKRKQMQRRPNSTAGETVRRANQKRAADDGRLPVGQLPSDAQIHGRPSPTGTKNERLTKRDIVQAADSQELSGQK
jgi:hypothetical protein